MSSPARKAQAVATLKSAPLPAAGLERAGEAPSARGPRRSRRYPEGKIKIDIYPSMQLGGTPPQLYDQARDGVADTRLLGPFPGNTPGRLPTTEVFELPFIASKNATANARARRRNSRITTSRTR